MHGIDDLAVEAAVHAYVKLIRASRAVFARLEPLLAKTGLTATQFGVLEALLHKGAMTQRELGRKVLTSAGNMTDVLDKLEARALLRRVRSTEDRRSVRVELTPAGRSLIETLFPEHARDIAAAMGALPPEDLAVLGDLLRRLGRGAAAGVEPPAR